MTGQPNYPGFLVFDVTNLEIDEPQPPLEHTEEIIDLHEPFDLSVTFTGSGPMWNNMVRAGNLSYRACFYLEGLGSRAEERDLGCATGRVRAAQVSRGTYKVTHRVNGIRRGGLYKVGATVEFPGWTGILGHYGDLMIQVSFRED